MKNYRRCVSCRQLADRQHLWRVVRTPAGVQLDGVTPAGEKQRGQRVMGRSAYLCPQADCWAAARKKNRLARALKAPVNDHIYQQLHQRLVGADPTRI
jgi:uncharacterized protein